LPFTPLAATLDFVPDRARRDRDIEPCPSDEREAIEEALRHFGVS
jgi:hypothetical protein